MLNPNEEIQIIAYNVDEPLRIPEQMAIEETLTDLNEELTLNSIIPYCMFKTKYIKALDLIMYCTNNRVNSEYDNDYYSYQASFGFTAEGYAKGQVYMIPDIISLYLRIYKLLLRKEK